MVSRRAEWGEWIVREFEMDMYTWVLSHSAMFNSLWPHGLYSARFFRAWDCPGKNTGVGCHFLLQWLFPTQESNPRLLCLLHWQAGTLPLSHVGSPGHAHTAIFKMNNEQSPTVSDQSLSRVQLFATPWIAARQAPLSITNSRSSLRHVHQVSDAIQPSHPLSSPSPPAPNPSQHQSLFQWVNSSHEVPKVLEFQL